ncbi:MAG: hypothetical protein PQJ58_15040 [Spirochaetales bacterium]|nr:hypothetical protein [Spirochaetales bacterium]
MKTQNQFRYGNKLYSFNNDEKKKLISEYKKDLGSVIKELREIEKVCIVPDCICKPIKSHSIQKSKHLKSISEAGKVYGKSMNQIEIESFIDGELKFKEMGIKQASVFNGFCQKHDNEIFKEIEDEDLDERSLRHNCLLFLRSISYEIRMKEEMFDFIEMGLIKKGRNKLAKRESRKHKKLLRKLYSDFTLLYEAIKSNKLENQFGFASITTSKKYGIALSTVINRRSFFKSILPIANNFDYFGVSFFPHEDGSAFNIIWRKGWSILMKKLLIREKDNILKFINHIIVSETEDTFYNIGLFKKLDKQKQHLVKHNAMPSYTRTESEIPYILDDFIMN